MPSAAKVLAWPTRLTTEIAEAAGFLRKVPPAFFPSVASAVNDLTILPAKDFALVPPPPMPPRKPKAKRKPPVSLSDEQLLALLERAKQHRYRDYVMILTTYWHGFRASETCALRETDYDLAAGTVRFKRGKGSEPGEHELQPFPDNPLLDELAAVTWWLGNRAQFGKKGGAKRGRVRDPAGLGSSPTNAAHNSIDYRPAGIPAGSLSKMQQSSEIVAFSAPSSELRAKNLPLEAVSGQKPAGSPESPSRPPKPASGQPERSTGLPGEVLAKSQKPGARSLLFPIGRTHFWRIVHGYALAAGIPRRKCKTHMLKHTIAKHLVRAGHPLNEIQEWMGWSTIETMNWYTRADEEELGHRIGDTIRAKAGLRQVVQGSLFP